METAESKAICPRCQMVARKNKRSYCGPCEAAHQREKRNPVTNCCVHCGEVYYSSHKNSKYCPLCKNSPKNKTCTECLNLFVSATRSSKCKPCSASIRLKAYHQNGEKQKRRDSTYSLTPGKFNEMLTSQDNRCAICLTEFGDGRMLGARVDHDHSCCPGSKSCGKCVRALLCASCNSGIGMFKDSPAMLERAIEYLHKF